MSYILDALNKSDVQRQTEPEPDRALRAFRPTPGKAPARQRLPVWTVTISLVALLVLFATVWFSPEPPVAQRASAVTPVAPESAPQPAALPPDQPAAAAAIISPRATPDSLRRQQARMREAMLASSTPPPALAPEQADEVADHHPATIRLLTASSADNSTALSEPLIEPENPAIVTRDLPSPTDALAEQADSAAEDSTAIQRAPASLPINLPARRELPADLRTQLPQLDISVIIYSQLATNRRTRIDGRMYFEGDQLAQALTLREIRPDSLVLEADGTLFRITQ